jgi:hypothetical protein
MLIPLKFFIVCGKASKNHELIVLQFLMIVSASNFQYNKSSFINLLGVTSVFHTASRFVIITI